MYVLLWVYVTQYYLITLTIHLFCMCTNSVRLLLLYVFLNVSLQVLHSPFDDIIPRERKKSKKDEDKKEGKKSQSKATK